MESADAACGKIFGYLSDDQKLPLVPTRTTL